MSPYSALLATELKNLFLCLSFYLPSLGSINQSSPPFLNSTLCQAPSPAVGTNSRPLTSPRVTDSHCARYLIKKLGSMAEPVKSWGIPVDSGKLRSKPAHAVPVVHVRSSLLHPIDCVLAVLSAAPIGCRMVRSRPPVDTLSHTHTVTSVLLNAFGADAMVLVPLVLVVAAVGSYCLLLSSCPFRLELLSAVHARVAVTCSQQT